MPSHIMPSLYLDRLLRIVSCTPMKLLMIATHIPVNATINMIIRQTKNTRVNGKATMQSMLSTLQIRLSRIFNALSPSGAVS